MQTIFVLISAVFLWNAVGGDEASDGVFEQIVDKVMDASCNNAALKEKVETCYDSFPKWLTKILCDCMDEPYMTGKEIMDDYCKTENSENEEGDDDEEEDNSDEIAKCVVEKVAIDQRDITEDDVISVVEMCRRIAEHAEAEGLKELFEELKKIVTPNEKRK